MHVLDFQTFFSNVCVGCGQQKEDGDQAIICIPWFVFTRRIYLLAEPSNLGQGMVRFALTDGCVRTGGVSISAAYRIRVCVF